MKVLLIYELIPESTKFYVFPAVDGNSDLFKHLVGPTDITPTTTAMSATTSTPIFSTSISTIKARFPCQSFRKFME